MGMTCLGATLLRMPIPRGRSADMKLLLMILEVYQGLDPS